MNAAELIEGLLAGDTGPSNWREAAICQQTDPDAFFPEPGSSPAVTRQVCAVCQSCSVRINCLEWALARDERYGIWGGLTRTQRVQIAKQRTQSRHHQPEHQTQPVAEVA